MRTAHTAHATLTHALVGLGRFGHTHARRLADLPEFQLSALVDDAPTVRAPPGLWSLPVLAHVDQIGPGIESATVATSDHAHAAVALALMRRGCHVLVEKPLCLRPEEGVGMLQAAHRHGVTLRVGHLERFNPLFDEARWRCLHRESLKHRGQATPFLQFRRFSQRQANATDSVLDLMVHDLDLFAWLCGIPTDAPMQLLHCQVDARSVQAQVRLDGLIAEFESGYDSAPSSARMQVADGGGHTPLDLRRSAHSFSDGNDALSRQYRAFHQAVRAKGESRLATGPDGLAAVRRAQQILGR